MSRVIVVGAGIAGLACARELLEAGLTVSVRERASTVGGRMSSPYLGGRVIDAGASYFTARDPDFVSLAEDWCARKLARRWTDRFPTLSSQGLSAPETGAWRYATAGGLRSLVADLASRLRPESSSLVLRSPVSVVEPGPSVDGEPADAVVLAMPDPQAKRVVDARLTGVRKEIDGRRWEPVLTLAAAYTRRSWPEFDGAFVSGDPMLRWIADDGRRRGDGAPVLTAHSTSPFAAANLAAPQQTAAQPMSAALDRLLGCGMPVTSRMHRWTFARPEQERDTPFFFGSAERVGLAGDGWGSPKIETAWLSGRALGRHIARELGRG